MDATAKRIIAEKYEVVGILGEGGTGVVYDAVRTTDGRAVALKVMHATHAGDAQIRGRFQREAAILRRLDGPHVCPIYELGETTEGEASVLYIALAKIAGDSLETLLARGLVDVGRALDILLEVLEALAAAHDQGIIHRDLKPANVLLEGGTKAIVVDFGMSKIITGGGTGTTNLTKHNMVFGTPEYMSPEQARGDELDARCDLYATGIMLHEMLLGRPPFTGPSPLSVLTAHLTSDLPKPSEHANAAARMTPALEAVILHTLARDREERYASARALAAAIRRARAIPEDVLGLAPTAIEASSKAPDAFATTMPGTVLVERSSVDVSAPTMIVDRPPVTKKRPVPSKPPPAPAPKDESKGVWVAVWILVGIASIATGVWFALRP